MWPALLSLLLFLVNSSDVLAQGECNGKYQGYQTPTLQELTRVLRRHYNWVDLLLGENRPTERQMTDILSGDLDWPKIPTPSVVRAILCDADLSDMDLSDANLTGAILFDALLMDADLSGAILDAANLHRADLHDLPPRYRTPS